MAEGLLNHSNYLEAWVEKEERHIISTVMCCLTVNSHRVQKENSPPELWHMLNKNLWPGGRQAGWIMTSMHMYQNSKWHTDSNPSIKLADRIPISTGQEAFLFVSYQVWNLLCLLKGQTINESGEAQIKSRKFAAHPAKKKNLPVGCPGKIIDQQVGQEKKLIMNLCPRPTRAPTLIINDSALMFIYPPLRTTL